MDLVTLADAKLHLHAGDERNADVALKVSQASEIVISYIGTTAAATWTTATAPAPVQAATLILLGHLYENRGDDMKTDEILWNALSRYLCRSRDPVFA